MSRTKGARLWLEPEEWKNGKLERIAAWVIRDGSRKIRTGCPADQREEAERKLAEHIGSKYSVPKQRKRDPSEILILDVLNLYQNEVVPTCVRPRDAVQRIESLSDWWAFLHDDNGRKTDTPAS